VDAVPILEDIQHSLIAVCDDEGDDKNEGLPAIVRIAAEAALLLSQKYSLLSGDCELYQIAIGVFLHISAYESHNTQF
jgi:hypothetical protein